MLVVVVVVYGQDCTHDFVHERYAIPPDHWSFVSMVLLGHDFLSEFLRVWSRRISMGLVGSGDFAT